MKHYNKCKFLYSLLICLLISFVLVTCNFSLANNNFSYADSPEDISIFIRKPTYSVFNNDKVYFIDEADNLLKVYDTTSNVFETTYLDVSSYSIVGSCVLDDFWYFVISTESNNQIIKVDFSTLSVSNLGLSFDKNYKSLSAQNVDFSGDNYILFALSYSNKTAHNPLLYLYDCALESFDEIAMQFDESIVSIKNGLIKTLSYQDADGNFRLIFISDAYIYYTNSSAITTVSDLTSLKTDKLPGASQLTPGSLDTTNTDIIIIDADFVVRNSIDYLMVSYKNVNSNDEYIKIYSFEFETLKQTLNYKADYTCKNAEYLLFNKDYYSYYDGEKINYIQITATGELQYSIENPSFNITYFENDDFIYKKTNAQTNLFDTPWGSNSIKTINENVDVIVIGSAKLLNNTPINDYDFCLFTTNDTNYTGFIEKANLTEKTSITPAEAGYKPRVMVWPNTILYSMPTAVTNSSISDSLIPKKIMTIEDNSEVEVLNTLSGYTANNIQMLKVKVNGADIGYIKADCVRNPPEIVNFVITNATIQKDDTVVYLLPDASSTKLTFTLNSGKNVKINGSRNTVSGFTSITFNDEYGNEFTGYIETDLLKADSWSTLQIVGSVLIAINIGVLILILCFKRKNMGSEVKENNND